MVTVKQYAEERGITIQAVHQSMKGKYKKEALVGHVHTVDGVKWLDDEAVRILDEFRNRSPVVIEREDTNARIQELEDNEKIMLAKIAAQADRIAELAEWKAEKALVIAAADHTQLLLSDTSAELEKIKEQNATLVAGKEKAEADLQSEKEAHEQDIADKDKEIDDLRQKLIDEQKRKISLREWLRRRK